MIVALPAYFHVFGFFFFFFFFFLVVVFLDAGRQSESIKVGAFAIHGSVGGRVTVKIRFAGDIFRIAREKNELKAAFDHLDKPNGQQWKSFFLFLFFFFIYLFFLFIFFLSFFFHYCTRS